MVGRTASGKGFLTTYSSERAGCFVSSFFLAKTYHWDLFKFFVFLYLLPAGFSVSGVSPRQITFNFPASHTKVFYAVLRVTPEGGETLVATQHSSTNPTQKMFSVEPGTLYRFQMRVFDISTKQWSSNSSPVDVNVPSGKWQKTQFTISWVFLATVFSLTVAKMFCVAGKLRKGAARSHLMAKEGACLD